MPKMKFECFAKNEDKNGGSVQLGPVVTQDDPSAMTGGIINLSFGTRAAIAEFEIDGVYLIDVSKAK